MVDVRTGETWITVTAATRLYRWIIKDFTSGLLESLTSELQQTMNLQQIKRCIQGHSFNVFCWGKWKIHAIISLTERCSKRWIDFPLGKKQKAKQRFFQPKRFFLSISLIWGSSSTRKQHLALWQTHPFCPMDSCTVPSIIIHNPSEGWESKVNGAFEETTH